MPDSEAVVGSAEVGTAVDELIKMRNSVGWKIFMLRLARERANALAAFADLDLNDQPAAHRLQDTVKMYDWFRTTAETMIVEGYNQEQLLLDAEAEESAADDDVYPAEAHDEHGEEEG
jgi:hypothetical protein